MKKVIFSLLLLGTLGLGASAQSIAKTKTSPAQSMQKTKTTSMDATNKDKVKSTSSVPQKVNNAVRPKHKKHHGIKAKHKTSTPK